MRNNLLTFSSRYRVAGAPPWYSASKSGAYETAVSLVESGVISMRRIELEIVSTR